MHPGYRWGRRWAVAVCLFALSMIALPACPAEAGKIAVIFVDPDLNDWQTLFNSPRLSWQAKLYRDAGYQVMARPGTAEEVTQALLHPRVKAITFVGGDVEAAAPTLAGLDASAWRERMTVELQLRDLAAGLPLQDAHDRAERQAANFGLDSMANYSCRSLADASVAEQFVRPGGSYYGMAGRDGTCPLKYSDLLWRDVGQPLLAEHRVTEVAGPDAVCLASQPPTGADCHAWYEYGACLRRAGKADAMGVASLQWQADAHGLGRAFIAGWNGAPSLGDACR